MATRVDNLSSKIQLAMEKIGTTNGTAPLPSQDPVDKSLHEYYVAKIGEAYFKKRSEKALEAIERDGGAKLSKDIEQIVADTIKQDMKQSATLIVGQNYTLTLETRKPSNSLKREKLVINLSKAGWKMEKIEKLLEDSSEPQSPPKTFRAQLVRD